MNRKYLAAAAFACLLMSCGSGKNSVAVVDFSGEWNIVEVNGEKVSAENTPFLGFDNAEHRLYGNAGCNRLMGTFNLDTLNAGKISFGQVGATRMMCPDMKVEQSVLEALNKVAGYEEVGEGVSLNDADGKSVILLQKRDVKEVSIKDLEGTWQIMTVNGTEIGKTEKNASADFRLGRKTGVWKCQLQYDQWRILSGRRKVFFFAVHSDDFHHDGLSGYGNGKKYSGCIEQGAQL